VGYRTPVFIQRFPWRLHITYNLPHLRRCHSNSVNTGSRLPICSDVKTRKDATWSVLTWFETTVFPQYQRKDKSMMSAEIQVNIYSINNSTLSCYNYIH
jgi:hypothetical protein